MGQSARRAIAVRTSASLQVASFCSRCEGGVGRRGFVPLGARVAHCRVVADRDSRRSHEGARPRRVVGAHVALRKPLSETLRAPGEREVSDQCREGHAIVARQ